MATAGDERALADYAALARDPRVSYTPPGDYLLTHPSYTRSSPPPTAVDEACWNAYRSECASTKETIWQYASRPAYAAAATPSREPEQLVAAEEATAVDDVTAATIPSVRIAEEEASSSSSPPLPTVVEISSRPLRPFTPPPPPQDAESSAEPAAAEQPVGRTSAEPPSLIDFELLADEHAADDADDDDANKGGPYDSLTPEQYERVQRAADEFREMLYESADPSFNAAEAWFAKMSWLAEGKDGSAAVVNGNGDAAATDAKPATPPLPPLVELSPGDVRLLDTQTGNIIDVSSSPSWLERAMERATPPRTGARTLPAPRVLLGTRISLDEPSAVISAAACPACGGDSSGNKARRRAKRSAAACNVCGHAKKPAAATAAVAASAAADASIDIEQTRALFVSGATPQSDAQRAALARYGTTLRELSARQQPLLIDEQQARTLYAIETSTGVALNERERENLVEIERDLTSGERSDADLDVAEKWLLRRGAAQAL